MRHAIPDFETQRRVSEIAGLSARLVALLGAVEHHPGALTGNTEALTFMLQQTRAAHRSLVDHAPGGWVDAHQELSGRLRTASDCLVHQYRSALQARRLAKGAEGPGKDRRADAAWADQIAVLADLHNAMEDLRDTVETLDCLQSPIVGPSYQDVARLFEDLEH